MGEWECDWRSVESDESQLIKKKLVEWFRKDLRAQTEWMETVCKHCGGQKQSHFLFSFALRSSSSSLLAKPHVYIFVCVCNLIILWIKRLTEANSG